jgi:hypothetical protein
MNSAQVDSPKKKPYERPQLRVYGNIREMTQSKAVGGLGDNPPANNMFT